MAVEYDISSDVAVIKETGSVSQCARVTQMYSGQITYDDEAGSKFATATINGKSQRVMLCIAVNGTVNYDDVPSLYSTVDGHRCLNIVTPTETGTPDDVPSLYETVVIDGQNVRAVRCIMINKTPVYDGVSSTCTFTGDDGKTHTAQLVNKITGGSVQVIIKGTSPLNLPDAVANSLSYVKAFGGTEQRNLPDGYTQRQYIYMMAGSYVKVEDLLISAGYRVEFEFQTLALPTPLRNYIGGRANGMAAGGGFRLSKLASGGSTLNRVVLYGFENGTEYYDPTVQFQPNTRYKYTYTNGVCTLESGGSVVSTRTFTVTDTTSTKWGINSYVSGNDYWQTDTGEIYVYSVKVWNDQDELVMNLVPAIQQGTVPVVGLYDTVTGGFLTAAAGTFAAGPEAVPTPDAPMDIVSNNGVLKYGQYGKNLFDKDSSLVNGYINSSGAVVSGGLKVSTFIEIKPNTTYTISGTGDVKALSFDRYAYTYTAEQTPIAQVPSQSGGASTTFTTAQNAKYIRIQMTADAVNTCQLELGSTATEYEPYHYGLHTDGTVETINAHGKNLYNKADGVLFGYPTGNYTWKQQESDIAELSIMVHLEEGKTYTVTRAVGSNSTFRIQASATSTLTDGQALVNINSIGATTITTKTFTVPQGAPYVLFYVRNTALQSSLTVDDVINAFQVELGSTATEYAPYFNGGTATTEMLLKVGNYQDVQSILDGVVTRNVGVKVLDGTEGWSRTDARAKLTLTNSAIGTTEDWAPYCTHYQGFVGGVGVVNMPDNSCKVNVNTQDLLIKDATHNTDIDTWKQYLAAQYAAGTPVIVVYPLATPTTESVTGQTLQVTDGDNVLEITQASLDGLELEAKYKAAVSLTIQEVQDANLDNNVEVTIS